MNTVDALKDLYKTLCGSDYAGDPNPTDAEMISAIAKDASSGGSGGGRIIEQENDPEDPYYIATIEPGLSGSDFVNALIHAQSDDTTYYTAIYAVIDNNEYNVTLYTYNSSYQYDKATGIINVPD